MQRRRFPSRTNAAVTSGARSADRLAGMILLALACGFPASPLVLSAGEKHTAGPLPSTTASKVDPSKRLSPEMQAALDKLAMPGVKINVAEWCVDVDARVCLVEGMLELIACTKNTKEHESIIAIEAKPSHVHTALLLLRAKPGHPAMHEAIDPEGKRFIQIPPNGGPVDVFLVIEDAQGKSTERPISEFIAPADPSVEPAEGSQPAKFPTHTFLFAGSFFEGNAGEARTYVSDLSGNVISLATFGDELLCLPGIHEQADSLRMWQVAGDKLPAIDSKVTLRLRPQVKAPEAKPQRQ